jgi:hypothetical protein
MANRNTGYDAITNAMSEALTQIDEEIDPFVLAAAAETLRRSTWDYGDEAETA